MKVHYRDPLSPRANDDGSTWENQQGLHNAVITKVNEALDHAKFLHGLTLDENVRFFFLCYHTERS